MARALTHDNAVTLVGFDVWFDGADGPPVTEETSRTGTNEICWRLICKWSDRVLLSLALEGGATTVGGGITVTNPLRHPDYPWMAVTRTKRMTQPGNDGYVPDANNIISTYYCRMEVYFSILDPADLGEERIDVSASQVTAGVGTYQWTTPDANGSTTLSTSETPGVRVAKATISRSKNTLPNIPLSMIFDLIGKVNADTYLGALPESVLFSGASSSRRYTTGGVKNFNCTYQLEWQGGTNNGSTKTWNKFLRASSGKFEAVTPKHYDTGDLTRLGIHTGFSFS